MTATISTHTLDAADGTHAGTVGVTLARIEADGRRTTLFAGATDAGGRLTIETGLAGADPLATYELVFATGAYWAGRGIPRAGPQICDEAVIRFRMPDPKGRYHIPLILSPNGQSAWWSA